MNVRDFIIWVRLLSKKRFGRNDVIFIGGLLAAAVLLLVLMRAFSGEKGAYVEITVDSELYGTYALTENQKVEIEIDGRVANILTIQDGTASMTEADCPDLLCVHQKEISKENETIVCLPNKVVVKVIGAKEESTYDSIAG